MKILDKKVLSNDGKHQLVGKVYLPEGEIKGYFQVVHGMTEHIARYDSFMKELAQEGYITFGYDHIGHGYTALNDDELGFFAHENGDDLVARDVKAYSDAVFSEYGDHPYYLLGHSMGSFIVRMAAQKYVNPTKLIIMGTSGPNPASSAGLLICKLISKIKGEMHKSKLIEGIAFGSYNKRFESDSTHNWLTKDKKIIEIYEADKFCTFKFTVSAMHDLISLIKDCNSKEWFASIAKKMPIFLVSGADDPVGDYSKGVRIVEKNLLEHGADVTTKIYEDCRHEVLNDTCRDECVKDILEFIK